MKPALTFLLILIAFFAYDKINAQPNSNVQNAYRDSYTQELAKNYDAAIAPIVKIYNSDNYEANLRLGWLYYLNRNMKEGQNYYQRAVSLKPYSIEAKMGLITCLASFESWDRVSQLYDEILKIDPQNTTASYWQGIIFYNRKKYEAAAKLFENVIKFWPFDYDSNNMLGWSYLSMGKATEAKERFLTALMIRPNDTSAQDGLYKIK